MTDDNIFESEVQEILLTCPDAGEGVNRWLFGAAGKLHKLELPPEQIETLLEGATRNCGRDLKPQEIPRAVANSALGVPRRESNHPRWPERNYAEIERIARSWAPLEIAKEIAQASEASHSDAATTPLTEEIIDALFPGNPLLCAGASLPGARTLPRERWRGRLARQQFIVPSPMSKPTGLTAQGRCSQRSLDNTGPRRFLVIEFDFTEHANNGNPTSAAPLLRRLREECGMTVSDLCAALHGHLAEFRPLALVLHSGGKSLHGWYPSSDEATALKLMRYAVSLGADPATWTPCQFVRMPDGTREDGIRQRVLYFNPGVIA